MLGPPPCLPRACVTNAAEVGVPGVSLLLEFVSEQEEEVSLPCCILLWTSSRLLALAFGAQALLQALTTARWQEFSKRRVCHYGYRFDYTASVVFCCLLRPLA